MVGRYTRNREKFRRACRKLITVIDLIHEAVERLDDPSLQPTREEEKLVIAAESIMEAIALVDDVYDFGIIREIHEEISGLKRGKATILG